MITLKDNIATMPPLCDLHVHFREPGGTHKEDLQTGLAAAQVGGFGTVCYMPNTTPPIDNAELVAALCLKAKSITQKRQVNAYPVAAITKGMNGLELNDFTALAKAGAVAFSEDGRTVMNERLMLSAMERAAAVGKPIFSHTEDHNLSGGCLHKGELAKSFNLTGIPYECEENIVERDIYLASKTAARLHLCHISSEFSCYIIKKAKEMGVKVTAEVTPHNLTLTENDVLIDGVLSTNRKMNPPLRTEKDRMALIEALYSGVLDCICTDHAPHTSEEKQVDFSKAPFGVLGLETSFAVCYTELVKAKILTLEQLYQRMATNPLSILGADFLAFQQSLPKEQYVSFDLEQSYIVGETAFQSKSGNSPFLGKKLFGVYIQ